MRGAGRTERIPRFWILHISGWLVFAVIVFVDVFPRFRDRAPLTYDATFVGSLFVASLILRPVCQRILRRDTPWPRAMLRAAFAASVFGLPCGLIAEWSWYVVRGDAMTWRLRF